MTSICIELTVVYSKKICIQCYIGSTEKSDTETAWSWRQPPNHYVQTRAAKDVSGSFWYINMRSIQLRWEYEHTWQQDDRKMYKQHTREETYIESFREPC